jgi:hypothetical protein
MNWRAQAGLVTIFSAPLTWYFAAKENGNGKRT